MTQKICNVGIVTMDGREIQRASSQLSRADRLGGFKVRWAMGRMKYTLEPGLYAIGNPGGEAPVFVTANYKLSFDTLRKELGGLDGWILALDTKGINVWCAAGKGTFGTDELVRRIELTELNKVVSHRKLIVPQLGAVGVAAHDVKKRSGFSVVYGPVRAKDIKAFLEAGMTASEQMRQVRFSLYDRLVLTPVEFVMVGKKLVLIMAAFFILSGLNSKGYSTDLVLSVGSRSAANVFAAFLAGAVISPALLPLLPGRSFSFKGFCAGLVIAIVLALSQLTGGRIETVGWLFLIAALSSFAMMNFTGASTYTSLSGVKKEMTIAVPVQLTAAIIGTGLWLTSRFS